MIMPGHLAAGYLAAVAVIKIFKPELDQGQINTLLVWGTFFGMIPDLDSFWVFLKNKEMTFRDEKTEHRNLVSHAPLLWIVLSALIIVLADSVFVKYWAVILLCGTLTHFILDSIQYGVMWLWPFSRDRFALMDRYHRTVIEERNFIKFWWRFLKLYYFNFRATFIGEVLLTVAGLIVFFVS